MEFIPGDWKEGEIVEVIIYEKFDNDLQLEWDYMKK